MKNVYTVKDLIREFRKVIATASDERPDLQPILKFFSIVQTFRSAIPPTAEFVTIVKHRKPVLFGYLKKSISSTSQLNFILQLDMDYETAIKRLELDQDEYFKLPS